MSSANGEAHAGMAHDAVASGAPSSRPAADRLEESAVPVKLRPVRRATHDSAYESQ